MTVAAARGSARMLPHQLVPRDDRSSYIPRVETLVGPGAYVIPSTFQQPSVNAQMRVIHHQSYGREFASKNRHQIQQGNDDAIDISTEEVVKEKAAHKQVADRYAKRRERLRGLLEEMLARRAVALAAEPSPVKTEVLALSPSLSCTSNYDAFVEGYRQHRSRSRSRGSGSLRSPTSPNSPTATSASDLESIRLSVYSPSKDEERASPSQKHFVAAPASSSMTPLSYREYLATTGYNKRLKKIEQQATSTRSSPRRRSPHHHHHSAVNGST